MENSYLTYFQLATILPALATGALLLARHKGTRFHKSTGYLYILLMFIAAIITLFIPAHSGLPSFLNHFGFSHVFAIIILTTLYYAYRFIKVGKIKRHEQNIMASFLGGIFIVGILIFNAV